MDKETQEFLETNLFNGKIVCRHEGRGGLVYIVEHEQNTSPSRVAYKTIKAFEESTSDNIDSFIRETHSWLDFSGHYSIITPHFVKLVNDVHFVCMPFCAGDLRDLIKLKLDLTAVVNVALQIVKGMIVANSRGMIYHQDIKPENILYSDLSKIYTNFPPAYIHPSVKYSVRIADFGVANAWLDGYLGGTNAYKAPEQYSLDKEREFAPDIFAVGIVIAELYQGYHPAVKSSGVNPGKTWNGSRLRAWANSGARHFATPQSPAAEDLIKLLEEMLSSDPDKRPSFLDCYKRLSAILKTLSSITLEQMELLFDYYDCNANHRSVEGYLYRQLKLSELPIKRQFVKEEMMRELNVCMSAGVNNLENILEIHHRANALQQICRGKIEVSERAILIEASRMIVKFVLASFELITAQCLLSVPSFGNSPPKKLGTDIEARSEFLCTSIERLKFLDSYDEKLKAEVESGHSEIEAFLLMREALNEWVASSWGRACILLDRVRQLASPEPELDQLYDGWRRTEEHFKNMQAQGIKFPF